MQATLDEFATEVPFGILHSAPKTPEYQQKDPRTCFYASLIASRMARGSGTAPAEWLVASQARHEGLLGRYGAETSSEFHDPQAAFVRKVLGLDIRFIDQRFNDERVSALTHGLRGDKKPVVFGIKAHWLVLDGFRRGRQELSWIGMDPASGQRLEESGRGLSAGFLAARLVDSGLPLVVVEGTGSSTPRFRPAKHKSQRFSPASTRS